MSFLRFFLLAVFLSLFALCKKRYSGNLKFCDAENVVKKSSSLYFKCNGILFRNGDRQTDEKAYSGQYSIKLNKNNPYGMTFIDENVQRGDCYEVSVWRNSKNNDGFIVVDGEGELFYRMFQIIEKVGDDGWEFLRMRFTVPFNHNKEKITFFVWNPSEDDAYFDDFTIRKFKKQQYSSQNALYLHIDDTALSQLNEKRLEALKYELLVKEKKDWVTAYIIDGQDSIPVALRLKGDWTDHLATEKWSFRIKTKGDKYWNHLKEFSIQNPATRGYLHEWILHQLYEKEDVLSTAYGFVPVTINGVYLGVYAYEEHFVKHLLELRNRREAPILKFDESGFFERFKYKVITGRFPQLPFFQSAAILPFKKNRTVANPILHHQFLIAQNLMYEYKNCLKPASEIFDVDALARYAALVDVARGFHAIRWHNQRFYYNPVTSKLEPIGFDAYIPSGVFKNSRTPITIFNLETSNDSIYMNLFKDRVFARKYYDYLEKYSSEQFIVSFLEELKLQIEDFESVIREDDPYYHYEMAFLSDNAKKIREQLASFKAKLNSPDELLATSNADKKEQKPDYLCKDLLPLQSISIKGFIEKKNDNICYLKLFNYHCEELNVIGTGSDQTLLYRFPEAITMPPFRSDSPTVFKTVVAYGICNRVFFVMENVDSIFSAPILQWPHPKSITPEQELFDKVEPVSNRLYTVAKNKILFKTGTHLVSDNIIIPENYLVTINAGTILNFEDSVMFISKSPVYINGTRRNPVIIRSSNGLAGGFTILEANAAPAGKQGKSMLKNVIFDRFGALNFKGWKLTGAITFYKSDVEITNCVFKNNLAEDALNIIRSDFSINDTRFENTSSDALDLDFCKGTIKHLQILNCGNDGLDISGSEVSISSLFIDQVTDKGISIGEGSVVRADTIVLSAANIGVTSKDLSEMIIEYLSLEKCKYGLAVFEKKPEYGPAKIVVNTFEGNNINTIYRIDNNSTLILERKKIIGQEQIDIQEFYNL